MYASRDFALLSALRDSCLSLQDPGISETACVRVCICDFSFSDQIEEQLKADKESLQRDKQGLGKDLVSPHLSHCVLSFTQCEEEIVFSLQKDWEGYENSGYQHTETYGEWII